MMEKMKEKEEELMMNEKLKTGGLNVHPFDEHSSLRNEVEELYLESFPQSERKPFEMILNQGKIRKMELYIVTLDDQLAGLAFLIPGETIDVLDYLAISPKLQGQKIGTRMLKWLNENREHPFVVEIESTLDQPNKQKADRKRFYLTNDMIDCGVEFELFGVKMEMLSAKRRVDFSEYESTMENYFGRTLEKHMIRHVRNTERA